MKMENKATPIATTEEKVFASYDREDIELLIKNDLMANGYAPLNISFSVGSKYVEDEWGMNRHLVSYFEGATAEVSR